MAQRIAFIPVRGGSKGIVDKNFRLLLGRPMASWTIQAAIEAEVFDEIVVSSDAPAARLLAMKHGVSFAERSEATAGDAATIADAVVELLDLRDLSDDDVVCVLQATSPLRSAASIRSAMEALDSEGATSLMSVHPEQHLSWFQSDPSSKPEPLFAARLNRQQLQHKVLKESGAIQACRVSHIRKTGALQSNQHLLHELPSRESVDIDTLSDLAEAERLLSAGTIIFRVTANKTVGTGHYYHCAQLAAHLKAHDVRFLLRDCDPFVSEAVADRGFPYEVETEDHAKSLDQFQDLRDRRLVVNDVLDTTPEDLIAQRAAGFSIVSIEDLGAGLDEADLVINALYAPPHRITRAKAVSGARWAPLRPEFGCVPSVKNIREHGPYSVLLTFGGADPGRFTERCAQILSEMNDVTVTAVVGPAYAYDASPLNDYENVNVVTQPSSMAALMFEADLIVTSAGRTVFEAASTGSPTLVLAQNAREATHSHLTLDAGVIFMGLGALTTDDVIRTHIRKMLDDHSLRSELSTRLKRHVDTLGIDRISQAIETTLKGSPHD